MKRKKKHVKEATETSVVETNIDYAGTERSPYRDWMAEHNNAEVAQANPDIIDEREGLYFQDTCVDERLAIIAEVAGTLTTRQQTILRMCGNEGRTIENCAAILGITRGTVQKTLDRIREKVKARLTKEGFSGV